MFTRPVQFSEAIQLQSVKQALPTSLTSAQLRALAGDIKRRATFSARTTQAEYLDQIGGTVQDILTGQLTPAQGRLQLKAAQTALGLRRTIAEGGDDVADLTSDKRLDLILKTNVDSARGFGQFARAQATVETFPCMELIRFEDRRDPRDWESRWKQAAQAAGDGRAYKALVDGGRMVARKDSAIWEQLGNLFDDGLGNPYPPFAFNSGMDWLEVERDDAVALGVIDDETEVAPRALPDLNAEWQSGHEYRDARLRDALTADGLLKFVEGILVPA
jgi:hypothetical protein